MAHLPLNPDAGAVVERHLDVVVHHLPVDHQAAALRRDLHDRDHALPQGQRVGRNRLLKRNKGKVGRVGNQRDLAGLDLTTSW